MRHLPSIALRPFSLTARLDVVPMLAFLDLAFLRPACRFDPFHEGRAAGVLGYRVDDLHTHVARTDQ